MPASGSRRAPVGVDRAHQGARLAVLVQVDGQVEACLLQPGQAARVEADRVLHARGQELGEIGDPGQGVIRIVAAQGRQQRRRADDVAGGAQLDQQDAARTGAELGTVGAMDAVALVGRARHVPAEMVAVGADLHGTPFCARVSAAG